MNTVTQQISILSSSLSSSLPSSISSSSNKKPNKPNEKQNQKPLNQKQINRKVSDIIHIRSIISNEQFGNKNDQIDENYNEQVYENDFEEGNQNQNEEMEEIKSQFQTDRKEEEIADQIGEDVDGSIEVVSEILQSNDPQFAKFKRQNTSGTKREKEINDKGKSKDKDKQKSQFIKIKPETNKSKNTTKTQLQKQKIQKKRQSVSKKIDIPQKQIQIDSAGKSASGLTKQQVQRYNAIKMKKKIEQQEKLQKQINDKQKAKAHQKERRKELAEKMKKIAQETDEKLRKKEQQERKLKQQERNNQRGANRSKSRARKSKKVVVQDDEFAQNQNTGDQAVSHGAANTKIDEISIVKTQLSVIERLKNGLAKKKEVDKQIKNEIAEKLIKLKQNPKELKREQVKILRNQLKQDQKKHKMEPILIEQKQQSTTKAKLLKNQIKQLRTERHKLKERIIDQQRIKNRLEQQLKALQTQQNIIVLDKNKKQYTSFGLVQNLKKVDKTLQVDQVIDPKHHGASDQTPIQKFTNFFFKQNYEQSQIFNVLNINDDDILTLKQIQKVCKQLNIGLTEYELKQVFKVLDYDSSGSLSKDQFDFIIGKQIESKINLKKILGKIQVQNPIEIQERILDLRARIKYMQKFVTDNQNTEQDPNYANLIRKIQKYNAKLEKRKESVIKNQTFNINSLREELRLLEVEKENEQKIGQIVKQQIGNNIKQKSQLLKGKVEQQLKCREKLYQLQSQFQQQQLRYITLEKIIKTKQRHVSQGDQKQKEKQAELRAAKQYRNKIMNKKTSSDSKGTDDYMRLLAATLMIQRNYKKRKAMKQLQQMKEQKQKTNRNK